jgi:acyl-CoA reductase-like NAD-dependent aldehyde dehydrogenase
MTETVGLSPREATRVLSPVTEEVVATVAAASIEETDAAIARAAEAFPAWKAVSPGDRARLLRRFASIVDDHIEELAQLEVRNSGHTIGNARWEAGNVRDVVAYYSAAPERLLGQQIPVPGGMNVTFHEPLGVVGVIVPWNFPMPIAGWGFAPALAAGNTVVLKPAEVTPLTAIRLGELALEVGIPDGVFTVLPGKGSVVGERFVTHPLVRKVCFTGSTEVGKRIMAGCAEQVKRLTLELGGKSANIVFADADLEKAAAAAPGAAFDNAGQDCCARSRILVQTSVYDRFLSLLEASVTAFRCTDPADPDAEMGPLISAAQRESVASYVDGAEVAFRGTAPGGKGFWFPPTVLLAANDTEYGLSGSIWTNDLGRAIRVSRGVETGNLSVNSNSSVRYWTPFGGVKQSGLGRELGPAAVAAFTEVKNVFFSSEE